MLDAAVVASYIPFMYFALTISTPQGPRSLAIVQAEGCTADEASAIQTHMRIPSVQPDARSRMCFGLGLAHDPIAARLPKFGVLGPQGRVRDHSKHAAIVDASALAEALSTTIRGFRATIKAYADGGARDALRGVEAQRATADAISANLATVRQRAETIASELRRVGPNGSAEGVAVGEIEPLATRIEGITAPDCPGEYWGATLTGAQYAEITGYVREGGKKINAIKALRMGVPHFGLKEAKDWIEGHWVDLGGKLGPNGEHYGADGRDPYGRTPTPGWQR